ncbi:MAG: hypothetical protein IT362_00720 [Deltaproteobacteria bacterium]|nr:hypothetical protein [Deltaproteobacteria bacterium]
MRNKTFFMICVAALLSCVAAYFVAVDRIAIPDRSVESTYRQFLLKASAPVKGRIIISSGSNAIYGIDAGMMERHFGRLTINLADNGNYPLEHKIYNLGNYVTSDDLIIFPLEWGFYWMGEKLSEIYVQSTLDESGSTAFYYRELPFYAKALFVFKQIPLSLSLKRVFALNSFPARNSELRRSEREAIGNISSLLSQGLRGSDLGDSRMFIVDSDTRILSCDQATFRDRFRVSERFRMDLKLLQSMAAKTGAKVVFTWPSVVGKIGNECYTSEAARKNMDAYVREIKAEVEGHGFKFIGDPYESRFDSSCFKDTYYHILHHCAVDRTARLIEHLESEGLMSKRQGYSSEAADKTLSDYALGMESSYIKSFGASPVDTPIEKTDLTKYLYFRQGWGPQEKEGLWSVGLTSTIIIPKPEKAFKYIRLKGRYLNGIERTGVWINDNFVGSFKLTDQVVMVGGYMPSDGNIRLMLDYAEPVSMADPGLNDDQRKTKYVIQGVELMTDKGI